MATRKAAERSEEISIMELRTGAMHFNILGTSPLICNRMSQKAWFELLAQRKKTTADRAGTVKHDPIQEFRDSAYMLDATKFPDTAIGVMAGGFKKGMGVAALTIPGAKKAEIGRLVGIPEEFAGIYGVPRLLMSVVRSKDMNKTPDIRTRAIVPEWACRLCVTWVKPALNEQGIANLLAAAGLLSGVGDWRQEKGSGSFGAYKLVEEDDADFVRITTEQGRDAQFDAFATPEPHNEETSEMLAWFDVEMKRRGMKVAA
jgi:hypothetical protein